jgi:hypothetical protein
LFGRPLPYSRFSGWIDRAAESFHAGATPTGTTGEARSPLDRLR